MLNHLRNLFSGQSSDDSEDEKSHRRRELREQYQRDTAAKEAQQRLENEATQMIGAWGWDLGKRSLTERVGLLIDDRKTRVRLFDQYPGEFHYLVKKALPGGVTRTLYRADGTRQLHAAYWGHARDGLEGGYDVACCVVPAGYASAMPVHECPFLPAPEAPSPCPRWPAVMHPS